MRSSFAPPCVERASSWGARLVMLAALVGQLAMLAHAALVVHVTCAVDGELVHARSGLTPAASRSASSAAAVARAAADSRDDDEHEQCLLDDDGEAACPNGPSTAGQSLRAPCSALSAFVGAPRRARRAPLYRLAPKNSPPA